MHVVSVARVISVLGYGLLPVIALAAVGLLVPLGGSNLGRALAGGAVAWSTFSATRLFELTLGMAAQRYLVAYPIGLVYACFVLITIF